MAIVLDAGRLPIFRARLCCLLEPAKRTGFVEFSPSPGPLAQVSAAHFIVEPLESLTGEYQLAIEAEQRQLRQVERRHGIVVRFAVRLKGEQLARSIRLLVNLAIVDTHLARRAFFRRFLPGGDEPLEPTGPLTLVRLLIRVGRRRRGRLAHPLAFVRPLAHFVSEGFAASRTDVGQGASVDPPVDHVRHPLAERFPFGNKRMESILVLAPTSSTHRTCRRNRASRLSTS